MADVNRGNRPLSPHMTVYRWPVAAVTSILTRVTGNGLLVGALLVVWWFLAAAMGPEAFATADAVLTSWFGDLVLFLSLWALWYHLLAGLRHLYWDSAKSGWGYEIPAARMLSWACIVGSVVLTVLTAIVI